MILVFSDIHLSRDPSRDPFLIENLCDCVSSYSPKPDEVIFLGDLFDSYMDFNGRADPVSERFRPIHSLLRASDIPVSYFVGNHDPWHLTFFGDEFGVSVQRHPTIRSIYGTKYYLSHGDEEDMTGTRSRVMRYFMRTDAYYRIYRTLLPTAFGQRLPKRVSRRFGSVVPDGKTAKSLTTGAKRLLESEEFDRVIFGHSHEQSRSEWAEGMYYNTGSWYVDLSYLEIWPNKIVLKKWITGVAHQDLLHRRT